MNDSTRWSFARFAVCCGLACAALSPTPAFAEASRLGETNVLMTYPLGRWPDAEFDPNHNVYLAVKGYAGSVQGTFVSVDGVPATGTFTIRAAGNLTTARVCYASDADKFLVTWLEEPSAIVGQFVRYTASGPQLLGGAFLINADGGKYTDGGSPCEYSPASKRFLVAWTVFGQSQDVRGSLLDVNGTVVAGNMAISATAAWEALPSLAYNSTRNEFFVAYTLETNLQYTFGVRLNASTGAVTAGPAMLYQGIGLNNYPEVAYNASADQYLVISWYLTLSGGADVWGRLIAGDGTPLGNLIPVAANTFFEGGDGIGLAFNSASNTYFAAFQGPSKEAIGVQISAAGVPGSVFRVTVSGAKSDNFQPRVAADPGRKRFLVVSNVDFARLVGQLIDPTGSGTPPPTTPAPPPQDPKALPLADPAPTSANGNGRQQIYWQSDEGRVARWGLSDTVASDMVTLQASVLGDPNYRMVGTGDVNRDGHRDVFWRHDRNGTIYVWIMNGDTFVEARQISPSVPDLNWRIASTKDINGDGYPDFLWQNHGNGALAVWYLRGTTLHDGQMLNPAAVSDVNWRVAGTGDANGDGYLDIFWQHKDGTVALWYMRGADLLDGVVVTGADVNWRVRAVADINGDGSPDMVWQHAVGNWLAATMLQGRTVIDAQWINPDAVTAGWKIMGPK